MCVSCAHPGSESDVFETGPAGAKEALCSRAFDPPQPSDNPNLYNVLSSMEYAWVCTGGQPTAGVYY